MIAPIALLVACFFSTAYSASSPQITPPSSTLEVPFLSPSLPGLFFIEDKNPASVISAEPTVTSYAIVLDPSEEDKITFTFAHGLSTLKVIGPIDEENRIETFLACGFKGTTSADCTSISVTDSGVTTTLTQTYSGQESIARSTVYVTAGAEKLKSMSPTATSTNAATATPTNTTNRTASTSTPSGSSNGAGGSAATTTAKPGRAPRAFEAKTWLTGIMIAFIAVM